MAVIKKFRVVCIGFRGETDTHSRKKMYRSLAWPIRIWALTKAVSWFRV